MIVMPYLFFAGNCEEAMNFYSNALGSPIDMLMRMKDSPEPPPPGHPPGSENQVMHASMHIGKDTILCRVPPSVGRGRLSSGGLHGSPARPH